MLDQRCGRDRVAVRTRRRPVDATSPGFQLGCTARAFRSCRPGLCLGCECRPLLGRPGLRGRAGWPTLRPGTRQRRLHGSWRGRPRRSWTWRSPPDLPPTSPSPLLPNSSSASIAGPLVEEAETAVPLDALASTPEPLALVACNAVPWSDPAPDADRVALRPNADIATGHQARGRVSSGLLAPDGDHADRALARDTDSRGGVRGSPDRVVVHRQRPHGFPEPLSRPDGVAAVRVCCESRSRCATSATTPVKSEKLP